MKSALKEKSIALRKKGLSYSEILKQVPVAKSTLSVWLHSVCLSKHQKQRLTEKKLAAILRGASAKKQQRIEKSTQIKQVSRNEVLKLIKDPLWLTGTMLYWAEGAKEKLWRPSERVAFTNMDLASLKIFQRWSIKYLHIKNKDLTYELYIHEKSDINMAKKFWIKNLSIHYNELRVYFKRHNFKPGRKNLGDEYHGVMKIKVSKSTDLNRKIAGWIEGVIEYFKHSGFV